MRVYKTGKKKKKAKVIVALSFLCSVISLFSYVYFVIDPIIIDSTYAQIETQATSYVSDAIKETMLATNFKYDDFMIIKYNNEGNVASMAANTYNINYFAREVAIYAQNFVDRVVDQGVQIPIGTFTGLSFLAGRGVKLNFKLVPIGSIHVGFDSKFASAGVNQTLHTLSIIVTTNMTIIMPLSNQMIEFKTEYRVCENLIVGEVPNVFLSGDLL